MYTREITYENLDGEMVVEEHSFNLTKAEAVEMQFSRKGGIEEFARKIMATQEHGKLIELFKDLILKTYGIREGQRFIKSQELTDAFVETGAYSSLFIELASDAQAAIAFFKGIFPKEMQGRVDDVMPDPTREFSDDDLLHMSWEEFYTAAGGRDDKKWDRRFLILAYRRQNAKRRDNMSRGGKKKVA